MSWSSKVRDAWQKARGQVVVTRSAHGTSVLAFNKYVQTGDGVTSDVVIGADGSVTVWTQPSADRDGTEADDEMPDEPGTDYEAG